MAVEARGKNFDSVLDSSIRRQRNGRQVIRCPRTSSTNERGNSFETRNAGAVRDRRHRRMPARGACQTGGRDRKRKTNYALVGLIAFASPSFNTEETRNVVRLGDLKVQARTEEPHVIPPLVSGGAIVLGVLLMGAGMVMDRQ